MIYLNVIQFEHQEWANRNFPNSGVDQAFKGVVEEVGELAHALLKQEQGIRINENHEDNAQDSVGDIIIYLIHLCNLKGWDIERIIKETWEQVKNRNWNDNKINGGS